LTALYNEYRKYGVPYFIILIGTIYTIYAGDYFYNYNNQIEQLTQIKILIDPTLYLNDIFLRRPDAYPSLFYQLITFVIKTFGISLSALYFWTYAATTYFILLAFFLLSREMFGNDASGYINIILFPSIWLFLGGQGVYLNFMAHTNVAYAVLLFSIYYFIKKQFAPSFIILGFAVNIHIMYAFFVACLYIPYILWNYREFIIAKVLLAVGAGLLIASPTIIGYLQNNLLAAPSISNELYIRLLRLRFTHHKFPLEMGLVRWCGFFITLAFLSAFLYRHPVSKQLRTMLLCFFSGLVLVMIIGIVFADLIPIGTIANLSLFRIMVFYTTFTSLFFGQYLVKSFSGPLPAKIAALLLVILFTPVFIKFDAMEIMISAIILICVIMQMEKRALPALLVVFLLLWLGWKLPKNVLLLDVVERSTRIFIHNDDVIDTDWERCQIWAKNNTARDDVFITPPYLFRYPFQFYSERAVAGTFKDGSVLFFKPSLGKQWWELMKDFGLDEKYLDNPESSDYTNTLARLERYYYSIGRSKAEYLAKKYHANYLIMPKKNMTALGVRVYENGEYIIYRMVN
jgi:hypothetical protein